MKLQWNYWLQTFLAVATKRKSEMTSYLHNGYDVMSYFAKFEKFLPHSIVIASFMTVGIQMPELDRGAFLPPPPYKVCSQNTPYKLELMIEILHLRTFIGVETAALTFRTKQYSTSYSSHICYGKRFYNHFFF